MAGKILKNLDVEISKLGREREKCAKKFASNGDELGELSKESDGILGEILNVMPLSSRDNCGDDYL